MARLKGAEVTRFKGLGEISPGEFKQFIGADIRLTPVQVQSMGGVRKTLEFLMGKNTPERRRVHREQPRGRRAGGGLRCATSGSSSP